MKVKLEFKNIDATVDRIISDDVRLFANETWWKLYQEFVPMDNGNLYGDVEITGKADDVEITSSYIHHKVPYAKKMYKGNGINFSKAQHSKATAYWDKVAWNSQGEKLIDSVKKYIKRKG